MSKTETPLSGALRQLPHQFSFQVALISTMTLPSKVLQSTPSWWFVITSPA